ncbi:MAG: hypothetical protein CMP95_03705 [Gammaproteobacteria bacterium]|uniref:Uncharacterized protein n=1 Tax=OM182 bacterium TaxID=2510334 RepID=A0A520S1E2_9GAMM|nr:hypothetical protein [Gammaproteobacteria bacterium]RZO76274.1 MAG: hypothetical protein EVA68_04670 [OM182 bacterium]
MLLVGLIIGVLSGCSDFNISKEQMALNDRGVAEMGRYEYSTAQATFQSLVKSAPDWLEARNNLAIATLNRQKEGDELKAFKIVKDVLREDPENLRALYVTSLIHLYLGKPELAVPPMIRVTELDEYDGYAAYFLGQAYLQMGDNASASNWFLKSVSLDPYLRSAYWAGSQALRRIGREQESEALLLDYQRFAPNPAARLASFSYTRMGGKAETLSIGQENFQVQPRPEGKLFGAAEKLSNLTKVSSITATDVDRDDFLDFFLVNEGKNGVLLTSGFEKPELLEGIDEAILWGDIDDDGQVDIATCGKGGVSLIYQKAASWIPALLLSDKSCDAGALFDADHDGDLDILATGPEGNQLLINNRDGTFRDIAEEMSLLGVPGKQVLVLDIDADRDLDILILGDVKNSIWQNDRTWQYKPFPGLVDLKSTFLKAVTAGDTDADGHQEIYGVDSKDNLLVWRYDGVAWAKKNTLKQETTDRGSAELAIADFDGDGNQELLRSHDSGFEIMDPNTGYLVHEQSIEGLQSAIVANIDPGYGPSIVTASQDGVYKWPPGPGRYAFLSVLPSGRSEADQMRSNGSGIGTQARMRVAGKWTVEMVLDSHSGPGQSLMPLSFGLRGYADADYIALTWSDGVTQTEIDLMSGKLHVIAETQRQLASCPVIFVWDGDRYRFITDVLGVGGMGFFTSPGIYAKPRPFERYLLGKNVMKERGGRYHIKLTEPMEENAYLDAATIYAYDLSKGYSMVLDERMGDDVTGRPIIFKESVAPYRVVDKKGRDVTSLLATADLKAPDPGSLDKRFIGLLEEDQEITLEFNAPIKHSGATLVADGWVEYPYSQTVFAAWQAGLRYRTVTIEARDDKGNWYTVASEFGYPAGMPRKMTLPLMDVREGSSALRLSSNMEIYWDKVELVYEVSGVDMSYQVLKPDSVQASRIGFPERRNNDQKAPSYDYEKRSPYWDTKFQRGFYTALGDATELVERLDGAVAIIGGGEELHMEFIALPPPAEEFNRFFVLDFRGWAKDMDLYTKDGETVDPLPMPSYADETRREFLHSKYNVRFQEGF